LAADIRLGLLQNIYFYGQDHAAAADRPQAGISVVRVKGGKAQSPEYWTITAKTVRTGTAAATPNIDPRLTGGDAHHAGAIMPSRPRKRAGVGQVSRQSRMCGWEEG